LHYDLRFLGG